MRAAIFAAMLAASGVPAGAATFVYVSNADDGDIGMYTLQPDGTLKPGERFKAAKLVMPMAVSPDKRFLFAAVRSKPFRPTATASTRSRRAEAAVGTGPLAESFPYISLDRTRPLPARRLLRRAPVSVNPVGADGKVGEPLQVIPTARNAHAILTDNTNRFVFVPHLGTDQVFQFRFDAKTGQPRREHAAGRAAEAGHRSAPPRHLARQPLRLPAERAHRDGDHARARCEDRQLKELDSASALPPDTSSARACRAARSARPAPTRRRATPTNDIWAADLHLTPDGKFLYASERTGNTIGGFSVDGATGKLTYIGSTPTEKQPRGFAIDPTGRYIVVSGEKSDTISIYAIDAASGALKPLGALPDRQGRELGRDRQLRLSRRDRLCREALVAQPVIGS